MSDRSFSTLPDAADPGPVLRVPRRVRARGLDLVCNCHWTGLPGSASLLGPAAALARADPRFGEILSLCDAVVLTPNRAGCTSLRLLGSAEDERSRADGTLPGTGSAQRGEADGETATGSDDDAWSRGRGQRGEVRTGRGRSFLRGPFRRPLSLAAVCSLGVEDALRVLRLADADTGRPFFWVLAVHDGTLSALGDRAFATGKEALAYARALSSLLGLTPKTYGEEASLVLVEEQLSKASRQELRQVRFQPPNPVSVGRLLAVAGAALLLACLVFGALALKDHSASMERLLSLNRSRTELAEKKREALAHPERHFPSAWMGLPATRPLVEALVPRMLAEPLAGNGWRLVTLEGTADALSRTWEAGPSASLLHPPGNAVPDPKDASLAHESVPLTDIDRGALVPEGGKRDWRALPSKEEARTRLAELTRRFGLRMRLAWKRIPPLKVGEERVPCPWERATLTLERVPAFMAADARAFARALDVEGVVVTSVVWDGTAREGLDPAGWSVQAEVYARSG